MTIDGVQHHVEGGSTIFVPCNAEHGIVNEGEDDLRWFYVFPTATFSDIIYRFSDVAAK